MTSPDQRLDNRAGNPSTCERCGVAFSCGIATGACWCAALPRLSRIDPDARSCLCRACLERALADESHEPLPHRTA